MLRKVYPTCLWYEIGHKGKRHWLNGIEVLILGMHASNVFLQYTLLNYVQYLYLCSLLLLYLGYGYFAIILIMIKLFEGKNMDFSSLEVWFMPPYD